VGKQRRGGIVTLVERKSGFALAGQVQRLKAHNVARCVKGRFAALPAALRRTMTFDNGKEFADHRRIASATRRASDSELGSSSPPTSTSTLHGRTMPGNAAATKASTACCVSSFPKRRTWRASARSK
jgi:hypothetical protein